MRRLGAEELIELGKYHLSRMPAGGKRGRWCVLDRRQKGLISCHATKISAAAAAKKFEKRGRFGLGSGKRFVVVKGKKG